jgi:hypothetical protein
MLGNQKTRTIARRARLQSDAEQPSPIAAGVPPSAIGLPRMTRREAEVLGWLGTACRMPRSPWCCISVSEPLTSTSNASWTSSAANTASRRWPLRTFWGRYGHSCRETCRATPTPTSRNAYTPNCVLREEQAQSKNVASLVQSCSGTKNREALNGTSCVEHEGGCEGIDRTGK